MNDSWGVRRVARQQVGNGQARDTGKVGDKASRNGHKSDARRFEGERPHKLPLTIADQLYIKLCEEFSGHLSAFSSSLSNILCTMSLMSRISDL
mgnify:FL=1